MLGRHSWGGVRGCQAAPTFCVKVCRLACGCGAQSFLESEDVKQALNQSQSALAAITVLKKVGHAPRMDLPRSLPSDLAPPQLPACKSCDAIIFSDSAELV